MTASLLHFARYRDIAADVAARLAAGGTDAIVASSGMANAITAEALRNSARGAVSLRHLTIETFARQIVNDAAEYPRIASDSEAQLAMRSAARAVAELIIDTPALGAMLQRSYRDVRDSGLTIDEFEARVRASSIRNRRRIEAMIRAWRDYERLISQVGAVDAADVLARASDLIAGARINPQIIAGFYDMTGAQLRIVHALAQAEKLAAIFVPSTNEEPFANRFVAQLPESALSPHSSVLHIKAATVAASQYDTTFNELREVCRAVKELIDKGAPPSTIAIVARSLGAHDTRLINRFAGAFGFSTTATESIPLFAHRIGRTVRTLLRVRQRMFPRADVIDLLRDGFRISRQISIDALDDVTRRANIACGDSEAVRSRAGDYADVLAEIESFAPSTALSGAAWASLLERIVERFHIDTDEDVAAADAIAEIAAMLRRAETWRRRFDAETIVAILEARTIRTAEGGCPPHPVWVGDVMRFRGRTFTHVFAIRMEDEVFPQRRSDDPLLPDRDRRALGLREIGDGRDEERLLFQLLGEGADTSVHYSVASSDGLGKLIRPSAFLRSICSAVAMPPLSAPRAAARPPHSRPLQLIAKSGTRSEFDGYIAVDETRIRAALASLSPTHLEDFGECPQKFLLKHILGVRNLDEPERELHVNPRDKGSLDHRILERFYRSLAPRDIDDAAVALPQLALPLRERLDTIIDEAFDELDSSMPPFNRAMRDIERRATKRHLRTFVAADLAELVATGLRPRDFEYAFGPKFVKRGNAAARPDAFVYRAGELEIAIEGQIDRIDSDGSALRVIDYKSGKALRHKDLADKIDRGVRLQLPLYALAVAEFFGIEPAAISGAIKPLRGGDGAKYSFDLDKHAPRLRETIAIFIAAMLRGAFPAFPNDNDNDFNACKYCPVNHSCRTLHNDAEKFAVTRYGDTRTLLG